MVVLVRFVGVVRVERAARGVTHARQPSGGSPSYLFSMVRLRRIDDTNREAVEALQVSPEQQKFVSNVSDSLREAAGEPEGRALGGFNWSLQHLVMEVVRGGCWGASAGGSCDAWPDLVAWSAVGRAA